MRTPQQGAMNYKVKTRTVPAPYKGWNTRGPQADLPAEYALFLDNLFPNKGGCELRKGCSRMVVHSDVTKIFRSLLPYQPTAGVPRLFAGAQDGIYEITAGGTVTSPVSAGTNNEWESANVTTAGGSFLWCCNGVDKSRYFNGTAWTVLDNASTPALTGVTSTDVTSVTPFKSRLFFTVKNSLSFWYLPVNSVAGLAVEFPLGVLASKGGHLVRIGAWTVDSGTGPNDYFVAITSEGQVIVYTGYDPSSATNWTLVGTFDVAPPVGKRPLVKLNGDLCALTEAGVMNLTAVLQTSSSAPTPPLSDNISSAYKDLFESYGSEFGWCATHFERMDMLIVNVPLGLARSWQLVMNTATGAWCRFVGWDAEAFAMFDGQPVYARNNAVYVAWEGTDDNSAAIVPRAKTSPNYFGTAGLRHHVGLLRIAAKTIGTLPIQLSLAPDFAEGEFTGSLATITQQLALWDIAVWDVALWPSTGQTASTWRTVAHHPGHNLALLLRFSAKGVSFIWYSTEYILQNGGPL